MDDNSISTFYTRLHHETNKRLGTERYGQALMNALYDLSPATWDKIVQTPADCFSNDRAVGSFFTALNYELANLQDREGKN